MKYVIAAFGVGILLLCLFLNRRDTFKLNNIPKNIIDNNISKNIKNFTPKISSFLRNVIIRQPGPLTKITISGTNQGRSLIISVNGDGIMTMSEEISLILSKKQREIGYNNNTTRRINISSYYKDGKMYEKTTVQQGVLTPVITKKCYDISEGPIQLPHIFSFDNILRESGYTFEEVYGKPESISLREFDRIFSENSRKMRRKNNKYVILSRRNFFENPFFYIFGRIDRLYNPNGTVNQNFLGLKNVNVSAYRDIFPSFSLDGIECSKEIKYDYIKKGGEKIEKTLKFSNFKPKPFKLFNPKEYGYDNTNVPDNIIRIDPVQGINFDNLKNSFENIPNLQDLANAYDANALSDDLPRGKKFGDYKYYGVSEPNLTKDEIRGIVRGPSKSTISFAEIMKKKYNMCRAELNAIIQPLNQSGNACPDSQDISLSTYVYNPAQSCDWAKIGDAWCSYEKMADDKMIICEWGKLYHGTSDNFVNAIMFVFSGTDDWSDVWSDVSFIPQEVPRINAMIHYGFYTEFLKWFPKIMKYLKAERLDPSRFEVGTEPSFRIKYKTPYKKIIFGGHSLGGAQAQIAAAYIRNLFEFHMVDVEVFTQAAPYPFSSGGTPSNYHLVKHSKRLAGYFFDECLPIPTRDDPVVDVLCHPLLGLYCHSTSETPLTEYISRDWSWDLFSGGWFRCDYDGTSYREWEPPPSALDIGGYFTFGLTSFFHKLLSTVEHPIGKYYEKSWPLCKHANNPNEGDKRRLQCDILKAQYDIEPSLYLQSILEMLKCDEI